MDTYQYIIFTIFFIIIAMIIIDENVGIYLILMTKIAKVNIERFIWAIRFHPNNPIAKWLIMRKSYKIAEQLQREYGIIQEETNERNTKNKNI